MQEDFQDRQYYTTGQLTQAIFDDQCAFIDPTTTVKGPKFYSKAVAALFDASTSRADLISAQVGSPPCFKAVINYILSGDSCCTGQRATTHQVAYDTSGMQKWSHNVGAVQCRW